MPRQAASERSAGRKINLLPGGPYSRFHEAYARMQVALALAGKSERDAGHYQERVYWELREPLHEFGIADLHGWWHYNQEKLLGRSRTVGAAKPRIVLTARITRAGNFTVEWEPDGHPNGDWLQWHRLSGYAGYRPSNELAFIRDVQHLRTSPHPNDDFAPRHDRLMDAHLLACLGALVQDLEKRLKETFEVRWDYEFVLDWEPEDRHTWSSERGRNLLGWRIEDVAERARQEGLAELAALLERTQLDAAAFAQLLVELDPDLTLEKLRSTSGQTRMRKKLQLRGIALTPTPLGRLVKLMEDHHAELLRPLWPTAGGGLRVVK